MFFVWFHDFYERCVFANIMFRVVLVGLNVACPNPPWWLRNWFHPSLAWAIPAIWWRIISRFSAKLSCVFQNRLEERNGKNWMQKKTRQCKMISQYPGGPVRMTTRPEGLKEMLWLKSLTDGWRNHKTYSIHMFTSPIRSCTEELSSSGQLCVRTKGGLVPMLDFLKQHGYIKPLGLKHAAALTADSWFKHLPCRFRSFIPGKRRPNRCHPKLQLHRSFVRYKRRPKAMCDIIRRHITRRPKHTTLGADMWRIVKRYRFCWINMQHMIVVCKTQLFPRFLHFLIGVWPCSSSVLLCSGPKSPGHNSQLSWAWTHWHTSIL